MSVAGSSVQKSKRFSPPGIFSLYLRDRSVIRCRAPTNPHPERKAHMKMLIALQSLRSTLHAKEDGATAVEYGLMVSLIAIVIIVAVALVGTNLSSVFNTVQGAV
jgi:pilus assembly protein Flp/PilA